MKNEVFEVLSRFAETEKDIPLSSMTTLRIGGPASIVVYPDTFLAFDQIMRYLNEEKISFKVIGKGSDLLCSDERYDGVVIRLDRHLHHTYFSGNKAYAEGGASVIAFAVNAMKCGLSGLEFASGIPGTVGGAVFMNAGAYRSCMAEITERVLVYKDGDFVWMTNEECCFSYRESIFTRHPEWVIMAAEVSLQAKDRNEIEELMEDRRSRRMASQPLEYPSCGSVFRNPEGMNAWQLIDGIGYRGKRRGGAVVSEKHCNFIVNTNSASAEDYIALVNEMIELVEEKYEITLVTEMEKFNWK